MSSWESLRSLGERAYGTFAVPVMVALAVLVVSTGISPTGGAVVSGLARTMATILLMGVAAAVAHAVVERRQETRHASIRDEIAAAGGLRQRLMV
jgi:peptidoglycan/LPS O-acetylase OafA/YrhL